MEGLINTWLANYTATLFQYIDFYLLLPQLLKVAARTL